MELKPGAAAGMAIGAQIAQIEPAQVVTTGMRTEVHGGIDCTRTPVCRGRKVVRVAGSWIAAIGLLITGWVLRGSAL